MVSIVADILIMLYEIIDNDEPLKESIIYYKCNFIKKSTLLDIILSNKLKSINPKITLLMNYQYILGKGVIL